LPGFTTILAGLASPALAAGDDQAAVLRREVRPELLTFRPAARPWWGVAGFPAATRPFPKRRTNGMISARLSLALLAVAALAAPAAAQPSKAFVARCGMCHQAGGEGLAGQFPRLAGRAAAIAQNPEGRRYMARVVLYGLSGPIEIEGVRIRGFMPGMATMPDAEIADILSHAVALGKPAKAAKPFKPAEIAAVRAAGRVSAGENAALRAKLVTDGVIK
jgi:cytochrome c553